MRVVHHRLIRDNDGVAVEDETLETPTPGDEPEGKVEAKPWGVPGVMVALAVPFLLWVTILALSVGDDEELDLSDSEIVASLLITMVLQVILIGVAAGLALWRHGRGWDALGIRKFARSVWWWPIAAAAAAHIAIIAYGAILSVLGADAALPEQENLDQIFKSPALLPMTGFVTVIMAPLAEETFFRGFIFAGLIRPLGVPGAMAVSGFIFGAFHVNSPEMVGLVLPFGLIGMLFAWLYYRTGSIWPPVATHLLFNLVSFIALASVSGSG